MFRYILPSVVLAAAILGVAIGLAPASAPGGACSPLALSDLPRCRP